MTPRHRRELEARTLTGIGRALVIISLAGCVAFLVLSLHDRRILEAGFWAFVMGFLVKAWRVCFPPIPESPIDLETRRRQLDAAVRFPMRRD